MKAVRQERKRYPGEGRVGFVKQGVEWVRRKIARVEWVRRKIAGDEVGMCGPYKDLTLLE